MAPAVSGPEVARVEDRTILGPYGEIPIRIYTPDGAGPHAAFVYLHGGGFILGSIEMSDATCRELADGASCIVVSVAYRLAPENKFPIPMEDCYATTQWVIDHAAEIGADARRVAVAGDSAGGNLAAAVCLIAKDRGGPAIAQQTLIYPVTNHAFDTPSYRDNGSGYILPCRLLLLVGEGERRPAGPESDVARGHESLRVTSVPVLPLPHSSARRVSTL
jgi:acetyl esterase